MTEPVVLLIHDDPESLGALTEALSVSGFIVCGAVADRDAASEVLSTADPAALVVRMCAPEVVKGIVAEMRRRAPWAHILVLAGDGGDCELFGVLEAGADAYLEEALDPAELPSILRRMLAEERVMSTRLIKRILEEFRRRSRLQMVHGTGGPRLTTREVEVLEAMVEGLTTQQIARRLFIAPVTVRSHISALLHKLHVPDRAAAVALLEETDRSGDEQEE